MKRTSGLAIGFALSVVAIYSAAIVIAQQPAPLPATQGPLPVIVTPSATAAPMPLPIAPQPMPATPKTQAPSQPMPQKPTPAAPTAAPPNPATERRNWEPADPIVPLPVENAIITGQTPADGAMENLGPTGRQEPAVSLEWVGAPLAKVGQVNDYSVVVRNACNIPVQQVLVRVRLTGAANVVAADPKPTVEDNVLTWDVGTLMPKQEKPLQLRMAANARGDVGAQAWVTFTGSTVMKVRVREPKLSVKASGPERVMVGDATAFTLTVTNPGDGLAEHVKIGANLSAGLEHARGSNVEFAIGNLGPNETRSVQVVCLTKAGGEQCCTANAEADGGVKCIDRAACTVVMPRLDLEARGPKLRYLDRKAVYTIRVTNPGDAPATNVMVNDVLPAGFKFVNADGGGQHDGATRTVSWFLGEVAPGQSRELNVEVLCAATGEFAHKVAAQGSRGLKVESETITRVEGLSAMQVEVSDVEDPVELNGEATYEIRITNAGSITETDVKLACTLPADKLQFKSGTGPTGVRFENGEVVCDPMPRLTPKADVVYRITVKCISPGSAQFKARVTSSAATDPVTKEESTRIYAD